MQDKDFPSLYGQYHGCWCPGVAISQGINSHDIGLVKQGQVGPWTLKDDY